MLTESAVLQPGACYITGTSVGPFYDTGRDIDDLANTGRVYLSAEFITTIADELGYAPPVAWQRTNEQLADLRRQLADAQHIIEVQRVSLADLTRAGFTTSDPPPAGDLTEVLAWVHALDERHVAERATAAFHAETLEATPRPAHLKALGALIPKENANV